MWERRAVTSWVCAQWRCDRTAILCIEFTWSDCCRSPQFTYRCVCVCRFTILLCFHILSGPEYQQADVKIPPRCELRRLFVAQMKCSIFHMDVRGSDNWDLGGSGWGGGALLKSLCYRTILQEPEVNSGKKKKRTRVREITSAGVRRRVEEDKTRESKAECRAEK